jgi:hypothetical protein
MVSIKIINYIQVGRKFIIINEMITELQIITKTA